MLRLKNIKDDGKELIRASKDAIFHAILGALDCQHWSSQTNAATTLHTLFGLRHSFENTFVAKEFQPTILEGLPHILRLLMHDRSYRTVGGAAALLALSESGMFY